MSESGDRFTGDAPSHRESLLDVARKPQGQFWIGKIEHALQQVDFDADARGGADAELRLGLDEGEYRAKEHHDADREEEGANPILGGIGHDSIDEVGQEPRHRQLEWHVGDRGEPAGSEGALRAAQHPFQRPPSAGGAPALFELVRGDELEDHAGIPSLERLVGDVPVTAFGVVDQPAPGVSSLNH